MNGGNIVLTHEPGAGGFSCALKAILLLALGACVSMSSCSNSETIWSAESRSPDGAVIASARAVLMNKGLSIISVVDTSVYLNWSTGRKHPMLILELADASDAPVDTHVEMRWLAPTHLELTYKGNQSIVFQAVKWASVDISVRDLASEKPAASAVDVEKRGRSPQASPWLALWKTVKPPPGHLAG
jgi:hypothetical protein